MSLTALHDAFVARTITRGVFIRRLVGFGMALPVAIHYTTALAEVAAAEEGAAAEDVAAATDENPHDLFAERHPEFFEDYCLDEPDSPLCGIALASGD